MRRRKRKKDEEEEEKKEETDIEEREMMEVKWKSREKMKNFTKKKKN